MSASSTSSSDSAAQPSGPLGAEESKCRQACEKGPRFHFDEALKAELRRKPEEEHAALKAGAEERWKEMRAKHQNRVQDCVQQCTKMAKPGEVDCLIAAKNMAETQACIRKYKSRPKGAMPKKSTTTRSTDLSNPGAVKTPRVPGNPSVPKLKAPTAGLPGESPKPKGKETGVLPTKQPAEKSIPTPRAKGPSKAASPSGPKVTAPSDVPKAATPRPVAVPGADKK